MAVWLRELAGWALMGLGLFIFAICYFDLIQRKRIFEAGLVTFIGFLIFRAGMHLLKVAMAARAYRDAAQAHRAIPLKRQPIGSTRPMGERKQNPVPGPTRSTLPTA